MSFTFDERYEILERVNRGGMAEIYKVKDRKTDEIVALKKLLSRLTSDRRTVRDFYREAKLAAKFDHPNVIKIFKLGKDQSIPCLLMEYVEGKNLKELLIRGDEMVKGNPLPIILGIGEGLNHIHQNGVIHWDVKPENVLISRKGEVKITDFGLARSEKRLSRLFKEGVEGTLSYMSPEQFRGRKVDERSDIYSFGVTMYEILTGRLPFTAEDGRSLAKMHLDRNIRPKPPSAYNEQIPSPLETVILKALEKDPARRHQSVAEILVDLRRKESCDE